jgi:hypothetical protein
MRAGGFSNCTTTRHYGHGGPGASPSGWHVAGVWTSGSTHFYELNHHGAAAFRTASCRSPARPCRRHGSFACGQLAHQLCALCRLSCRLLAALWPAAPSPPPSLRGKAARLISTASAQVKSLRSVPAVLAFIRCDREARRDELSEKAENWTMWPALWHSCAFGQSVPECGWKP